MIDKKYFDMGLNKVNAKKKGYEYVGDIIYENGQSIDEIKRLLEKEGCKLGKAVYYDEDDCYGMYRPI